MGTELALRDPVDVAERLYKSGLFKDTKDANQALAKILAGDEFGLGAVAALNGLHIIDGKIVPSAHVLAGRVKRSGRYDFRVVAHDNKACKLAFYDREAKSLGLEPLLGESEFTFEDAKRAGLSGRTNWQKYPRNMLFARALANGVRWYCPDVTQTGQVLVAEEWADESGAEFEPPGAVAEPEPVKVENVAAKWQPSKSQITELREFYQQTGWLAQDKDHERLRMVIAAQGADNAGDLATCLARLTEDQFAGVREALVEASVTHQFDATPEPS